MNFKRLNTQNHFEVIGKNFVIKFDRMKKMIKRENVMRIERVKQLFKISGISDFFFSSTIYSVKTGINAVLKAPSATRPLKKLGIINASKKASYINVVPKNFAENISLKSPKILEIIVPKATIIKALAR